MIDDDHVHDEEYYFQEPTDVKRSVSTRDRRNAVHLKPNRNKLSKGHPRARRNGNERNKGGKEDTERNEKDMGRERKATDDEHSKANDDDKKGIKDDPSSSTSHFSVYGPGGTAVSLTTTVGRAYVVQLKETCEFILTRL